MLDINELFLEIRKQVENIVQQELVNCDWYIGVSSSVCNGTDDKLLYFNLRYQCIRLEGTINPSDLIIEQDGLIKDVIASFVENYKNHNSETCDFFDDGCKLKGN